MVKNFTIESIEYEDDFLGMDEIYNHNDFKVFQPHVYVKVATAGVVNELYFRPLINTEDYKVLDMADRSLNTLSLLSETAKSDNYEEYLNSIKENFKDIKEAVRTKINHGFYDIMQDYLEKRKTLTAEKERLSKRLAEIDMCLKARMICA